MGTRILDLELINVIVSYVVHIIAIASYLVSHVAMYVVNMLCDSESTISEITDLKVTA